MAAANDKAASIYRQHTALVESRRQALHLRDVRVEVEVLRIDAGDRELGLYIERGIVTKYENAVAFLWDVPPLGRVFLSLTVVFVPRSPLAPLNVRPDELSNVIRALLERLKKE